MGRVIADTARNLHGGGDLRILHTSTLLHQYSALVMDGAGNLYRNTEQRSDNNGFVFEITP
jgi:hypothetical protein